MSAPFPPPRAEGLRTLQPELIRIVEALARAAEERDYQKSLSDPPPGDQKRA
jgi:hypothetical protein